MALCSEKGRTCDRAADPLFGQQLLVGRGLCLPPAFVREPARQWHQGLSARGRGRKSREASRFCALLLFRPQLHGLAHRLSQSLLAVRAPTDASAPGAKHRAHAPFSIGMLHVAAKGHHGLAVHVGHLARVAEPHRHGSLLDGLPVAHLVDDLPQPLSTPARPHSLLHALRRPAVPALATTAILARAPTPARPALWRCSPPPAPTPVRPS
jgi:hypothetical protein